MIADCREAASTYYRVREERMVAPVGSLRSCEPRITHARRVSIVLAREFTGASLAKIGHYHGGRHHATIIHSMRAIKRREAEHPGCAVEMESLRLTLKVYAAQKQAWALGW